jgi:hypothetical protein
MDWEEFYKEFQKEFEFYFEDRSGKSLISYFSVPIF